ncbi:NAD-dependent epimerase/dehydratase family protein [Cyanobacteria bacterium FACHB-DQ100]|nr:NAD-dependent epimerase/dehydratase family protein [Cyanobacteria bacterium FACHB-DQ100]
MKAFVTGSTGFVGANLVRLMLEEGFEVRSLVRPNSRLDNLKGLEVEIVQGDLLDENLSELMRGCQVLFHVAAHYSLWQRDRASLYQSNVLGTRNVLAAARTAGIERSVYTSSVAAIGVDPSGQPTTEQYQSPVEKLIGHYKQSKYWAEQEAIKAVQSGQDVVIVNPSTPIGAYDIKPTPTGDIVLRFLQRRMPSYVETGLNLVHVRDVAWGHLLALQKGKTGDRYILGNQNLSLKQMLEELSQITGLSAPARSVPLWLPLTVAWIDEAVLTKFGKAPSIPIDGVRMSKQPMYYNPEKAIRELGLPQTPIRAALKDAVHWFQYIHQDTVRR